MKRHLFSKILSVPAPVFEFGLYSLIALSVFTVFVIATSRRTSVKDVVFYLASFCYTMLATLTFLVISLFMFAAYPFTKKDSSVHEPIADKG